MVDVEEWVRGIEYTRCECIMRAALSMLQERVYRGAVKEQVLVGEKVVERQTNIAIMDRIEALIGPRSWTKARAGRS